MKTFFTVKYRMAAFQLLFWTLSINIWYFVFNPGVESSGVIKGLNEFWPVLVLLNTLFFLYALLPITWFIKNARKWFRITTAILFIVPIIYLLIQWIFGFPENEDLSDIQELFVSSFLYVLIFHLTIAAAVVVNLKLLIPRYLAGSRFGQFLVWCSLLIGLTAFLNFGIFDFFIDLLFPSLYFISYFRIRELIFVVSAYLIFTTLAYLVWQYAALLISNREKTQNELAALKAQVNPHFLFNNLNTIYSLASIDPEHSRSVILKLSDFLRYVLYDTAADTIPLEKEAEIIKTYVELQKERIDPAITTVSFTAEGDFTKADVSPLLLLPLTENCFKHGTGNQPGQIKIEIRFDGKRLIFNSENNISLREETIIREKGGLGIQNLEKRLNLLYPDRYSLRLEEKEGIFRAELLVELN